MTKLDTFFIYLPKPGLKQPEAQTPLGILYLAAYLKKENYSVGVGQYAAFTLDEAIKELPEASLYGITAMSLEIPRANTFAKKIKEKYPDSKIIIGGPGTCTPEFINFGHIDSVCYGEGELIIKQIVDDAKNDRIKREYVGEPEKDLDRLPFPARDLLDGKIGGNVFINNNNYIGDASAQILTSRGCPFKCAFCGCPRITHAGIVRYRSPQSVYKEVVHIIEKYGIKQFRFADDTFTFGKSRVIELCEKLKPLNIAWRVSARTKPFDIEMLQAMKDAGCVELSFGIESFDDEVLKGLNKKTTCADHVYALTKAKEMGFKTRILLMVRTPFQTKKTLAINKYWLKILPFDIMACTAFIPVPGCDVWYNPDKYNIEILNKNLDDYNFYMFGPDGRRPITPIIKIKDRDLDEFTKESEEFRDWVENLNIVNRG